MLVASTVSVLALDLTVSNSAECVVEDVAFGDNMEWTVTSRMLERCDKFGN